MSKATPDITLYGARFMLVDEYEDIRQGLLAEIECLEAELEEARAEIKDLEAS